MQMNFTTNLGQEQKLIMTQQMQMSVKILQMSSYDLIEHINQEFEENPLLDMENPKIQDYRGKEEVLSYSKVNKYLKDSPGEYYEPIKKDNSIERINLISKTQSLQEYLSEQLIGLPIDSYLKRLCKYIIGCLDNRGYLEFSIEQLGQDIGAKESDLHEALEIVQTFEPVGIASKDIRECLTKQVKKNKKDKNKLIYIIENNLDDLANNKYDKISKELKITIKESQELGDIIKKLEPKPSRGFYTGDEVKFIIPDAEIRKIGSEYFVIINDNIMPNLYINEMYNDILEIDDDKHAIEYITEKMKKAKFLIKSVNDRRNTLRNILEVIVNKQSEYFEKGVVYLKPMTLKEIAEEIDMHESTVSRAIREKYILTSIGTIDVKSLFTTGMKNSNYNMENEQKVSVSTIKKIIIDIVKEENKKKPLSDQSICSILGEKGIDISRRTVAKYREELSINSSNKRKRY